VDPLVWTAFCGNFIDIGSARRNIAKLNEGIGTTAEEQVRSNTLRSKREERYAAS
jgi:hypothetical protein